MRFSLAPLLALLPSETLERLCAVKQHRLLSKGTEFQLFIVNDLFNWYTKTIKKRKKLEV